MEEGDVRETYPRQEDEPKDEAASEAATEEAMDTGAESFVIRTPGKMSLEDEGLGSDDLADGLNTSSERWLRTPVWRVAVKRRSNIHDEEPDAKKIILDDGDENMGEDKGLDLDEVRAQMGR